MGDSGSLFQSGVCYLPFLKTHAVHSILVSGESGFIRIHVIYDPNFVSPNKQKGLQSTLQPFFRLLEKILFHNRNFSDLFVSGIRADPVNIDAGSHLRS